MKIDLTEIPENLKKNFRKVPRLLANLLDQEFDRTSVLNYGEDAGITSINETLSIEDPRLKSELSRGDVASILVLYEDV